MGDDDPWLLWRRLHGLSPSQFDSSISHSLIFQPDQSLPIARVASRSEFNTPSLSGGSSGSVRLVRLGRAARLYAATCRAASTAHQRTEFDAVHRGDLSIGRTAPNVFLLGCARSTKTIGVNDGACCTSATSGWSIRFRVCDRIWDASQYLRTTPKASHVVSIKAQAVRCYFVNRPSMVKGVLISLYN